MFEIDNKVVGFILGKIINSTYCEVIGFYVLPEYQNKGIGKKLLDYIKSYYKLKKCTKLSLWILNNAKNN